jgi:GH35 family endo-1,4-beta-xylanase
VRPSGKNVHLEVFRSDGRPVPASELAEAMVLDMEYLPPFKHKPEVATGEVKLPVPDARFAISVPLVVAGFGSVHVYADNGGPGYDPKEVAGRTLNFCLEAAESRVAAVSAAERSCQEAGVHLSSECQHRMSEARALLEEASARRSDAAACSRSAMSSLARSLHAGEMLVVERARARIASAPPRPGFLFGCNGFRYPELGEKYARLFGDLLNFVTLPFYRSGTEPEEGHRDYSRIEKILEWTNRDGLAVKGHPLVWFCRSGIPKWLEGRSYEQVERAHRDYVLDAVGRFRDRVKIWDIINEAHDWQNGFDYTEEQLVEMTRLAAEATREADPAAVRIVNSCCTWSEYVARGQSYSRPIPRPGRSVLRYLRDVIAAGVDFEVIGLQMYYPERDLFEIDRQLERFCALGKPVHISELGVSSSAEPVKHDPVVDVHIKRFWHGHAWTERDQADWVEAYYTICYAKPAIQAITWWDFCDPAFIPHGGFVDETLRPKESYHRLQELIRSWR